MECAACANDGFEKKEIKSKTIFIHKFLEFCYFLVFEQRNQHDCVEYIQISHRIAFAAPQNNEFTALQIALLTDKKFCEVALAVYVGCHSDISVIPKTA